MSKEITEQVLRRVAGELDQYISEELCLSELISFLTDGEIPGSIERSSLVEIFLNILKEDEDTTFSQVVKEEVENRFVSPSCVEDSEVKEENAYLLEIGGRFFLKRRGKLRVILEKYNVDLGPEVI